MIVQKITYKNERSKVLFKIEAVPLTSVECVLLQLFKEKGQQVYKPSFLVKPKLETILSCKNFSREILSEQSVFEAGSQRTELHLHLSIHKNTNVHTSDSKNQQQLM